MQARAQVELAKECFGALFEKPGEGDASDIISLASQMPGVVKDKVLADLCEAVCRVAQAETHEDAVVMKAIDSLQQLPDEMIKNKLAYPRARALIECARKLVLQRSLDSPLQGELTDIRALIDGVSWSSSSDSPEQVLVNSRFNASLLSKSKLRFAGLLSKASDTMKADRFDDISHMTQALGKFCQVIRSTQVRIFWTLMGDCIGFLARAVEDSKFTPDEQIKVHEGMQAKCFALSLTSAADFGLAPLLGDAAAKQHDAMLCNMAEFRLAVTRFVQNIENGEVLKIFTDIPNQFWESSVKNRFFDRGSPVFEGVQDMDALHSVLQKIYQAFAKSAATFLDDTLEVQSWFADLLRGMSSKRKDPWSVEVPDLSEQALGRLEKELQHACCIVNTVGENVQIKKACGFGTEVLKDLLLWAQVAHQRQIIATPKSAKGKKNVMPSSA